jgi:hypothetical protein
VARGRRFLAAWGPLPAGGLLSASRSSAILQTTFADCGYEFRHFEDCEVPWIQWQAGRNVADMIELSDGSRLFIERFELVAWSSTAEGLLTACPGCDCPFVSLGHTLVSGSVTVSGRIEQNRVTVNLAHR